MPRAPKRCGRPDCPMTVRGRTYCEDHDPGAWAGSGHGRTRAERELTLLVLDGEPICRDCSRAPSTEAGHIVARSRGGLYVRDNLKGQCRDCNLDQLAIERTQL